MPNLKNSDIEGALEQIESGRVKTCSQNGCHRKPLQLALEVVDDVIDHGEIGEEGDDLHLAAALGAGQGIDFINLADYLGPAAAGDPRALFLDDDQLCCRLLESFKREQAKNGRQDISIPF